ncbi:hypothetical protein [Flavobacterium album]|uniref:hypothetical protein n=1 Tax=Flavobacterium album TaxID=2175091 RepID=UPI0015E823AF|nr:hypothetical protein [Flavobacterium album]
MSSRRARGLREEPIVYAFRANDRKRHLLYQLSYIAIATATMGLEPTTQFEVTLSYGT